AAGQEDPVDLRRARVAIGGERAGTARVEIDAVAPLGEVDVAPLGRDVPEQGALADTLLVPDGRLQVPVAETVRAVRADHGDVLRPLEIDGPALDGVDRRAVRRRDVDAEVERVRLLAVARIV